MRRDIRAKQSRLDDATRLGRQRARAAHDGRAPSAPHRKKTHRENRLCAGGRNPLAARAERQCRGAKRWIRRRERIAKMVARQQGRSAHRCHPSVCRTNLRKRTAGNARLEPPLVPPASSFFSTPLYKETLRSLFQRNLASPCRLSARVVQTLRPLRLGSAANRIARQTLARAPIAPSLLRLTTKALPLAPSKVASAPRAPFAVLYDASLLGAKRATRDARDATQRRLVAALSRQRRA